jgi:exopolysaccharide production protein ExoY
MSYNGFDFRLPVAKETKKLQLASAHIAAGLDVEIYQVVKAVFDKIVAAVLLVFFLPFFAVVALLLLCFDRGPVLFRHERLGKGTRKFQVLKFRTMVCDADRRLEELLASDPAARDEWERSRKLKNDPRVSSIGRFLRKTSLDELPQLVNVLRGEMSLVGPRPIVEDEIKHYGRDFYAYQSVMPGVTGMWQVKGRSSTTYEERVALDVEYFRTRSFRQDLSLLLLTVPMVLLRRGAC